MRKYWVTFEKPGQPLASFLVAATGRSEAERLGYQELYNVLQEAPQGSMWRLERIIVADKETDNV